MLAEIIKNIKPLDRTFMEKCQDRLNNLIKPIDSLGILEKLSIKISGVLSCEKPKDLKSSLILVLPDEKDWTDYKQHKDVLDVFAKKQDIDIISFDQKLERYVKSNTLENQEYVLRTIRTGARFLERKISEDCNIICLSDVLGEDFVSFGNSLVAEDMDFIDLLINLGRPEIMIMSGMILKAAEKRTLIVIDSVAASVAALIAVRIEPIVQQFLVVPCYLDNKSYKLILEKLGLTPYLDLKFERLDGIGSLLFLFIVKIALNLLNNMKTFSETNVSVAEDGEG